MAFGRALHCSPDEKLGAAAAIPNVAYDMEKNMVMSTIGEIKNLGCHFNRYLFVRLFLPQLNNSNAIHLIIICAMVVKKNTSSCLR
jgi:hypothetical protein